MKAVSPSFLLRTPVQPIVPVVPPLCILLITRDHDTPNPLFPPRRGKLRSCRTLTTLLSQSLGPSSFRRDEPPPHLTVTRGRGWGYIPGSSTSISGAYGFASLGYARKTLRHSVSRLPTPSLMCSRASRSRLNRALALGASIPPSIRDSGLELVTTRSFSLAPFCASSSRCRCSILSNSDLS